LPRRDAALPFVGAVLAEQHDECTVGRGRNLLQRVVAGTVPSDKPRSR
jgi:hypothetical protein